MIKKVEFNTIQKGYNKVYVDGKPLDENFTLEDKAIARGQEELIKGKTDVRIKRPDLVPVANIELETNKEQQAEIKRLKEIEQMYLQLIDNSSGGSSTINATSVSVTPSASSISVGSTRQLTATFTPSNTTDQTGVWSTSNASIATVNSSGLVTGIAEGSATITFTSTDGSFTDTYTATVSDTILAFSGASGAGAYATGGRGGSVSVVTTLADSGTGSLRSFANVSNTTIIFDVSGVIDMLSSIIFTGSNVTIAGQTSPIGGITLDGARVQFSNVTNMICRYVSFRGGYAENQDTIGGYYMTNIIFDQCSMSFGGDEAISIIVDTVAETGGDITVQNCFIAESSTGAIMGGEEAPDNVDNISMIGNVWYNISHRFPNLNSNARYDVVNNYIHNHTKRMIRGNKSYELNEINNVYDFGNTRIYDKTLNHHGCESGVANPTIYTNGNVIIGNESTVGGEVVTSTVAEMNATNKLMWRYFYDNNSDCGNGLKNRGDQLEDSFFNDNAFSLLGQTFTILDATVLKASHVPTTGNNKTLNADGSYTDNTDTLDTQWKTNIANGNYIDYILEANYAVPAITSVSRPAGYYVSNSYIPEVWFKANVPDGEDHNYIMSDGRTALENFLNEVDK